MTTQLVLDFDKMDDDIARLLLASIEGYLAGKHPLVNFHGGHVHQLKPAPVDPSALGKLKSVDQEEFAERVAKRTENEQCFVRGCDGEPVWEGIYRGVRVLLCHNDRWRISLGTSSQRKPYKKGGQ